MMIAKKQSPAAVAWIGSILLSAFLNAQTFVMEPVPEFHSKVGIQYLRPDYTETDQTIKMSTFSGSYDIHVRTPIFTGFSALFSLPLIVKASDGDNEASGIGNLYLGLSTLPDSEADNYSSISFGAFLPTSTNKRPVEFMGAFANFYQPQKALIDVSTLYGNFLYFQKQSRGTYWGFEIGPQVFIPVKNQGGTTNLLGHYGISIGYRFKYFAVGGEILGLANLTGSFNSFGERFNHSAALGAQLMEYPIRPAVFYQVVISDQNSELAQNILNGIFAIRLETILR